MRQHAVNEKKYAWQLHYVKSEKILSVVAHAIVALRTVLTGCSLPNLDLAGGVLMILPPGERRFHRKQCELGKEQQH